MLGIYVSGAIKAIYIIYVKVIDTTQTLMTNNVNTMDTPILSESLEDLTKTLNFYTAQQN